MKVLLSIIFVFLLSITSAQAYTAVYTSPNLRDCWKECKHHIDRIWSSESWDDLDTFLNKVKAEAHGKDIILDFCVHGNDRDGLLSKSKKDLNYFASMGTVLNHVEKTLVGEKVTILFEACFASYCYRSTLKGNFPVHSPRYWLENHPTPLAYPIYGGGYSSNWCTLIMEEYAHSLKGRKPLILRDLRLSLNETTQPKDDYLALEGAILDFLRKLDQN